jgi:hypothetical protein
LLSEAEVQEKAEDKGKGKGKEKRTKKLERLEMMRELVLTVRELGRKVDMFADEVRVSNVLRNRVDREYCHDLFYLTDMLPIAIINIRTYSLTSRVQSHHQRIQYSMTPPHTSNAIVSSKYLHLLLTHIC